MKSGSEKWPNSQHRFLLSVRPERWLRLSCRWCHIENQIIYIIYYATSNSWFSMISLQIFLSETAARFRVFVLCHSGRIDSHSSTFVDVKIARFIQQAHHCCHKSFMVSNIIINKQTRREKLLWDTVRSTFFVVLFLTLGDISRSSVPLGFYSIYVCNMYVCVQLAFGTWCEDGMKYYILHHIWCKVHIFLCQQRSDIRHQLKSTFLALTWCRLCWFALPQVFWIFIYKAHIHSVLEYVKWFNSYLFHSLFALDSNHLQYHHRHHGCIKTNTVHTILDSIRQDALKSRQKTTSNYSLIIIQWIKAATKGSHSDACIFSNQQRYQPSLNPVCVCGAEI